MPVILKSDNIKKHLPNMLATESSTETTHQNPIAFTFHNPPESMQEIENHKAYLRRTRGWKV